MNDRLKALADAGVSLWLDDLSRERLASGGLQKMITEDSISGVTSNPTIFAKALSDADDYTDQVTELARGGADVDEAVFRITTTDVRDGCDLFSDVYQATDSVDGRVSLEVDPRLARNTDATISEARRLWNEVGRENLFIKIPATQQGLPAITAALAEGISVNVTLVFSLERYVDVMHAFFDGVEQAKAAGHDITRLGSVASFFVSRFDTEVDRRLDQIGSEQATALRGRTAIANARLAFQAYEQLFAGERWQALAAAGAKPQRPLWASTGTKDKAYPDTLYVTELVTSGVVNTMPQATIDAFADHGEVTGDTVRDSYAEAQQVIDDMERLGISYDDVVAVLEDEGVQKFADSWDELLATVTKALSGDDAVAGSAR